MRFRAPSVALTVALALGLALGCVQLATAQDGILYEADLAQEREAKDERFRTSDDSPLPPAERADFAGLSYFPADAAYRVPARLTRTADAIPFDLPHTRDETRSYVSFGTLAFEIGGASYQLEAFRPAELTPDDTTVAVFFYDATNGADDPARATYKGGRYLSLPVPEPGDKALTLDFNRAYHPYCVYNPLYVCPLPPPANRLPAPILAGERLPLPEDDLPQGWRYFTPDEGGFRVALPGTPVRSESRNANGNVLINYLLDYGSYGYLVNITQFGAPPTEAERQQLFEGLKMNLAATMDGTLDGTQMITVDGYEALALDLTIPLGGARLIAIPVGDRVVQLMTLNATPDAPETRDDVLVGSFEVLTTDTQPRLARLLDRTGLAYETTPDGIYRLLMSFEPDSTDAVLDAAADAAGAAPEAQERSQLVFVTESFDEMAQASYYGVFSMVYVDEAEPPAGLIRAALMGGSADELGGYTLTHEDGDDGTKVWRLYYLTVLPNTNSAEALEETLWFAAATADALEEEWVPGDEW